MELNQEQAQVPIEGTPSANLESFWNRNRKKIILIVGIFILVAAYVLLSVFLIKNMKTSQEQPIPTPPLSVTPEPTASATTFPTPITTISPQEQEQIKNITINNVETALPKSDIDARSFRIFGDYAVVTVFSKSNTTDPANVILKNENGNWQIIAGPGTYFDQAYLDSLNLPQEVKNEANIIK